MTMELTLRVAARLRRLSDDEFDALRSLVEDGTEPQDEAMLASVCEALADTCDMVRVEARTAGAPGVAHA